jgi:hypothetical protein
MEIRHGTTTFSNNYHPGHRVSQRLRLREDGNRSLERQKRRSQFISYRLLVSPFPVRSATRQSFTTSAEPRVVGESEP